MGPRRVCLRFAHRPRTAPLPRAAAPQRCAICSSHRGRQAAPCRVADRGRPDRYPRAPQPPPAHPSPPTPPGPLPRPPPTHPPTGQQCAMPAAHARVACLMHVTHSQLLWAVGAPADICMHDQHNPSAGEGRESPPPPQVSPAAARCAGHCAWMVWFMFWCALPSLWRRGLLLSAQSPALAA